MRKKKRKRRGDAQGHCTENSKNERKAAGRR